MPTARALAAALGIVATGCAGHAASSEHAQPANAAPSSVATGRARGSALDRATADLLAGRYKEAEEGFRATLSPSAPSARLGLAEVLLITGRAALAEQAASDTVGAPPAITLELVRIRGEALRRQGKLQAAETLLSSAAGDPEARRVRLLLGEVLLEQGKRAEAEPVLMTLIEAYNHDGISKKDGRALAAVGRAAYLLGSPHDANDAFEEAERAGASDAETLLYRAELFLDSYDPGHAEEVVAELLEKAPHHPEALARMAEVTLASNFDFDAAEKFAREALAIDPTLARAHFVLGGVALRDMDFAKADAAVDRGLAGRPGDLDLLSLRATVRFLADDKRGFEQAKAVVLAKNPRYSRLYQIVGEYAEWEHRYEEIVTMMREALLADSEDGKVRAQLGFNLIRSGQEADGVASLQRAFAADPFNTRVFNTLNLYEKQIPRGYESVTRGRFTLRYSREEREVLDRYVPPMLDRAFDKMAKGYGFTPATPIGIELYPQREHFAVRTSGLPQTFIQGVCFGKTLAAMSPKHERFNIGMTLWHELAHVFHIQLSRNRVPRWFTEGLAEYETLVERPEWRREYDADLYDAVVRGKLPPLRDMNRAFTHAEDMQDMATAYYASTQVVAFIAGRWGMPKIRRMLELWGQGKRTTDVIQEALAVSVDDVDREFRAALTERLGHYKNQFSPPNRPEDLGAARAAVVEAPSDPSRQARLALALMGTGDERRAKAAVEAALAKEPAHPLALWLKAQIAKASNDRAGAAKALGALVAAGHDGYAVQIALADVADGAARRAALDAAHRFDPLQASPLRKLVEIASEAHDEAAELAALRELVVIEENDGDAYRRLVTLLLARGETDEARRVGQAAVYVDIEDASVHRLYGEALAGSGDRKAAVFELESAVRSSGPPAELAAAHVRLAELLASTGDKKASDEHRKAASALGTQAKTGDI